MRRRALFRLSAAFSPDGRRLYFSSQRGPGNGGIGVTFEVTGPF